MKIDGFNRVFPIGSDGANGPESHIVKAYDAAMMLMAAQGGPDFKGVKFRKEALISLLGQEGVAGVGFYFANNGHHNTLVGIPVDEGGKMMLTSDIIAIENGERCPPLC